VICFTDDDCYPREDFLSRLAEAFEDSRIGFVGGRVLLFDPADLPITIKTAESGKVYAAGSFMGPGELHGANFAFRRAVLEQIGGFDPALGAGTAYPCEDCDALLRASEAGWAGRYDPSVVVYHHHRRRGQADRIKIEEAYSRGRGAFYAKALINSKRRLRVLGAWARSMCWFGIAAGMRELWVGARFLLEQRRAARLQERS
jgi:GT2 family glycosyltransferase